MFNVQDFRRHFPLLSTKIQGQDLVYLDNGASSLKPKEVAEAIYNYYLYETANIHRGAHFLSRQGTEKYEAVRAKVARLINAAQPAEIVFVRGVTEGINLLSHSYGMNKLKKGDVILLSAFEHHSNIIPWKLLCEKTGARIELVPFDEYGRVSDADLNKAFAGPVKIVSLLMYSNVTGVRLDVEKVVEKAREKGAVSVIDAAQAMLHEKIDVQSLNCDFLTFSGHKMLAPNGAGVLYGRKHLLDEMPPFLGGGSMISRVSWESTVYQDAPYKFEAGTMNIPDVFGLGTAIDFINQYDMNEWRKHGAELTARLEKGLKDFKKIKIIGPLSTDDRARKADIVSFVYEGAHASDVGELLDQMGIAVRAGHHCAQPLMDSLGITGTVRVSFAPYNTEKEVDYLLESLRKVEELL